MPGMSHGFVQSGQCTDFRQPGIHPDNFQEKSWMSPCQEQATAATMDMEELG